jgi:hypothetical protein
MNSHDSFCFYSEIVSFQVKTLITSFCVSDGSGALFLIPFFLRDQKKAGTNSTTRSFYEGARPYLPYYLNDFDLILLN